MYFWERKNGNWDSDEKSTRCGIFVKKEQECGIRTPLTDLTLNKKDCIWSLFRGGGGLVQIGGESMILMKGKRGVRNRSKVVFTKEGDH